MKFTRHAYHRKKRLKSSYRRPRGLHNKQRLSKKGSTPKVRVGYRTDKSIRGKKSGLEIVHVYNVADVESVDKDTQGIVIGKIGLKKKLAVLKKIDELNLTLLTGDASTQLQALQARYDERKKSRQEKREEREEKQQELQEEAQESSEDQEEESTPLTEVKGVGPSRIESLQEAGITSAQQLAEISVSELAKQADLSETVAKKLISAAQKTVDTKEDSDKEKVLTKAR